jgi:hypothetical protein
MRPKAIDGDLRVGVRGMPAPEKMRSLAGIRGMASAASNRQIRSLE